MHFNSQVITKIPPKSNKKMIFLQEAETQIERGELIQHMIQYHRKTNPLYLIIFCENQDQGIVSSLFDFAFQASKFGKPFFNLLFS